MTPYQIDAETCRKLRVYGSNHGPARALNLTGDNAFTVLRNWHDDPLSLKALSVFWDLRARWPKLAAFGYRSNKWACRLVTYWVADNDLDAGVVELPADRLPDSFLHDLLLAMDEASNG